MVWTMRRLACHASRVVAVVGAGHLQVNLYNTLISPHLASDVCGPGLILGGQPFEASGSTDCSALALRGNQICLSCQALLKVVPIDVFRFLQLDLGSAACPLEAEYVWFERQGDSLGLQIVYGSSCFGSCFGLTIILPFVNTIP